MSKKCHESFNSQNKCMCFLELGRFKHTHTLIRQLKPSQHKYVRVCKESNLGPRR